MPLFVMIGHDGADGAERRNRHREAHVVYWAERDARGQVTLAGPIRDDANAASVGAVIVFEAADLADARAIVQRDPFVRGDVFASLTVAPFRQAFPKPS